MTHFAYSEDLSSNYFANLQHTKTIYFDEKNYLFCLDVFLLSFPKYKDKEEEKSLFKVDVKLYVFKSKMLLETQHV